MKGLMFRIKAPKKDLDKNRVVLVDGDVVAYQASYGRDSIQSVELECKMLLDRIKQDCDTHHMIVYLTGKDNFRNEVATLQQYKGNRYNPDGSRKKPQPPLLPAARACLERTYQAEMQHTQEADDALSIAQTAFNAAYESGQSSIRSIISTIDKDLLICPGLHHDIASSKLQEVSKFGSLHLVNGKCKGTGLLFFYAQLLMGDNTDNIPGLPRVTEEMVVSYGLRRDGCGGTCAFRVLDGAQDELDLFTRVYECYDSYWENPERTKRTLTATDWRTGEAVSSLALDRLTEQGQLLWMRTYPGELWAPPKEILEQFYYNEVYDA